MLRVAILSAVLAVPAFQDSSELDRLIASLASDSMEAREKAVDRLVELGPGSLPALRKAAGSGDPEVRARAMAAINDIERLERERLHDVSEKERLLGKRREESDQKAEKEPGALFTGAARFELSTRPFHGNVVLYTFAVNYMYVEQRWEDIPFDVVEVKDKDGKLLDLERCGRCSPGTILVRNAAGPLRAHVKGTQRWYSEYQVEFKDPRNGDRKSVGEFSIQVEWPNLKVTSRRGWPKDVMGRVGSHFSFDVHEGVLQPIGILVGGGNGGHFGGVFSSQWWCACKGGPSPVKEKPKPELIRTFDVLGGDGYTLDQVKSITYSFFKPMEEPVEFTVEVPPP